VADLDTDRIAAAGLAVADERGASGFTMRAVADKLGVTPMALYHHVADKKALVSLVADEVVKERPLPAPTGDWLEDIWQIARWLREITHAHPAVPRLRRIHHVWTASMLPITEYWFSLWQQSGLPFDDAMLAGSTTSMAILGLVEEEQLFTEMDLPDQETLARTPNASVAFQQPHDRDAEFELVVRSLIEGILARLGAPIGERPRRRRALRSDAARSAPRPVRS
jgi:AcrR family transcriptional regulator